MKTGILNLFMLCLIIQTNGQTSPGGVTGPGIWIIADSAKATMHSVIGAANPASFQYSGNLSAATFNTHPAIQFSKGMIACKLDNNFSNTLSLFSVQHPDKDETESMIWNIQHNDTAELVLTNKRMADLSDLQYLNFTDLNPREPKVDACIRQSEKLNNYTDFSKLVLGSKPTYPELPVTNFSGRIPELIGYSRILNSRERNQVCSYLALKYGVTLSEPDGTYLDRNANIIWNGSFYPEYHHNIAGLGRDDSSGLFQQASSSQNYPELLTIKANTTLNDNDYFIWGDNGLPLSFEPVRQPGLPPMLQRRNLMVNSSIIDSLETDITLNARYIDAQGPVDLVYWLAVDKGGNGNYTGPGSAFIKMSGVKNGVAYFNNVDFAFGADKKIGFALTLGKSILLTADIKSPDCAASTKGSMLLKAWGAAFPCTVNIIKDDRQFLQNGDISNSDGLLVAGVSAGYYVIKMMDAGKNIYMDSFFVSDASAPPQPTLQKEYFLTGPVLTLNANTGLSNSTNYQWTGPAGFISAGSTVKINTPGIYTLSLEKNGCRSFQQFRVSSPAKNSFTDIQVNPNPSSGAVTVRVSLDKAADVSVETVMENGQQLSIKKLSGMANYHYTDLLLQPGIYFMIFRSGLDIQTRKIIIIR